MAFRFEGRRAALARLHSMGGPWGSAAEALSALRREAHAAAARGEGERCGVAHRLADDAAAAAACRGHFDACAAPVAERLESARNRAACYARTAERCAAEGREDDAAWARYLAGEALGHVATLRREAARNASAFWRAFHFLRGRRLGALALLALALGACASPPPGPPVRYGRSRDCRAILARAGVSNASAHCGATRVRVERGRFPR